MQNHRQSEFARIWCITNPTPGRRVTSHLTFTPHLSCKRDQIKTRDYMDRRVTPPKRVTSPTWGPPPPCKQALSKTFNKDVHLISRWLLSSVCFISRPIRYSARKMKNITYVFCHDTCPGVVSRTKPKQKSVELNRAQSTRLVRVCFAERQNAFSFNWIGEVSFWYVGGSRQNYFN